MRRRGLSLKGRKLGWGFFWGGGWPQWDFWTGGAGLNVVWVFFFVVKRFSSEGER